jgi:hypothetical protein
MIRFGILPEGTTPDQVDPYKTDRDYWEMFTYDPEKLQTPTAAGQLTLLAP